jgi:hypothetical protein
MTRQQVEDCVTHHLQMYGRGYSYDVQYNGSPAWKHMDGRGSEMQWVRDNAEKGDRVRVTVKSTSGHYVDTISFTVKPISKGEQEILEDIRERRRKKRDAQRSKFIEMEQQEFRLENREEIAETELRKLAQRAWDWLGIDADCPTVEVTTRVSRCSYYYPPSPFRRYSHHIGLAEGWGQEPIILLHELAHAAVHKGLDGRFPAHGKEFAGIAFRLWAKFLDHVDEKSLQAAANEYSVSYDLNALNG